MRILILDTNYTSFLSSCYSQNPGLADRAYDQQLRLLQDQCFGTADFYSESLIELGHEATDIISNCEPLQRRWAQEHGVEIDTRMSWTMREGPGRIPWPRRAPKHDWFYRVLAAQIKAFSPDVLYVQDMNAIRSGFLREMKQYAKILVGQIACPIDPGIKLRDYDLILSSFPHYVAMFRKQGVASEYLKLGFAPKILDRLESGVRYGAVFVGHLSTHHAERTNCLEKIASKVPLDVWGPGAETLEPKSALLARHHGEAWALDMYQILHQAEIVLNYHIDLAESYANNMRLYEATGVGAMLITDWKVNLPDLFEPAREIISYTSPEECAEMIGYYLEHNDERKEIARAGQQRTLREHTYANRMQELSEILERYLSTGATSRKGH